MDSFSFGSDKLYGNIQQGQEREVILFDPLSIRPLLRRPVPSC